MVDANTKTETYQPNAGAPDAAAVARMVAQAKSGVTIVTPDLDTPDPSAGNAGAALNKPGAAKAPVAGAKPAAAPAKPSGERPAGLPDKFKSWEDMAKAYTELEKKQGGAKAPEKTPEPTKVKSVEDLKIGDKPTTEAKAPADDAAAKAADSAGLDMAKLQTEFTQTGKLSDESLKAFEKVGISKEIVDSYIAGQMALAEKVHADIASVAGGPEKFNELREWSASNLSDTEKKAINDTLATGNHEAIKLAFAAVNAKWVAAVGQEPSVQLRGNNGHASGASDVYSHIDEMKADMRKPEYKNNQAFRDYVKTKLGRSGI